ncbi:MAG: DUF1109 domain-containing protein [Vicinamibacterales bacterium]
MNTARLIEALSADVGPVRRAPLARTLSWVMVLGAVIAVCVMLATVGPRRGLADAPVHFLALKLLFTMSLAIIGGVVLFSAMHPGRDLRRWSPYLLVPIVLVGAEGVVALALTPLAAWGPMMLGTHWAMCLVCIPLFATLPFALLIWAVRKGAPTELWRTGAIAGLVAGSLGAAAYSLHCPDDSLPFVAIWYAGSILLCALIGKSLGPRLLRW